MSDKPTCPVCTRESPDNLLCHTDTLALEKDLMDLPALWRELPTTYQRQAQTGDDNGRRSDAEVPLPYSVTAATVRDSVVNTVGTWIRELELDDVGDLAPNMRAWCGWLLEHVQRIRGHVAVAQIVDEMHYATGIVRQAVDRSAESVYCGKCTICGKELRANPDADTVTCRWCWIGGDEHTYPVPSKARKLWSEAGAALLTRPEILQALNFNGLPVKPATFRSWIRRGANGGGRGITPVSYRRNGIPLYRLQDAMDMAKSVNLTPDQSVETLAGG